MILPKNSKYWVAHSKKEVEEIAAGKRQHQDGTFYSAGELIYLIDRIFTSELPKFANHGLDVEARGGPDHSRPWAKLERMIEEGEN